MSSTPPARLFRTVRFRLALFHAGLTALTLLAVASASYVLMRSQIRREARTALSSTTRHFERAYFGVEASNPAESLAVGDLPDEVKLALHEHFAGWKIGAVRRRRDQGRVRYEMAASSGRLLYELILTARGELVDTESVTVADAFRSLIPAAAATTGGAEAGSLNLLLVSPNLEVLAASGPAGWTPAAPELQALAAAADASGFAELPAGGGMRFACQRLFDGNLIGAGMGLRPEATLLRRLRWTFGLLLGLAFPLSLGIGWYISARAMAGVQRVTAAAKIISAGHLDQRVRRGREGVEIEDLAESFNAMVARLERLVRELQDVTTNVAHDLRTPITRIRGVMETADWQTADPEQRQKLAGAVVEECERLVGLINTMLELAQADAGLLQLAESRFDLGAEVQKAVQLFAVLADEKGLKLTADVPPAPLWVRADRSRLQRALANLLDNAIKYTAGGGTVRIRLAAAADGLTLTVQDTGVGIAPEDQARIFERFYRGDRSRAQPGHGLGLSLVKAIVAAHGGAITVESVVGKGSAFTMRLPRSRQD